VQVAQEVEPSDLRQVLCVHRDLHGRVDGVGSAYPAPVSRVGNQELWVYSGIGVGAFDPPMIGAAFAALERAYDGRGPIGLCVLADAEMQRKYPQLRWEYPPLGHVGFGPDGRQVRVAYFEGARLASTLPGSE